MALELDGVLQIRAADGTSIHVRGCGTYVEIEVEGGAAGFSTGLSRARRALPMVRLGAIALDRAGMTATLRVGTRRVMTLGRGVGPDAVARLLRIPHTRLR
ncbi:MAG: hypothetical protein NVSMB5_13450 [Candidatus Velthaea sp.]